MGFGVRDFEAVNWADIWAAGLDIAVGVSTGGLSFTAERNTKRCD